MSNKPDLKSIISFLISERVHIARDDGYVRDIELKDKDETVARASLSKDRYDNKPAAKVEYFGVDPKHRGKGIGTKAYRHVIHHIQKNYAPNAHYVSAEVMSRKMAHIKRKVLGKPKYQENWQDKLNDKEAHDYLPDDAPETPEGTIDGGNVVNQVHKINKRKNYLKEMAPHVMRDLVVKHIRSKGLQIKNRVSSQASDSEYFHVDVGDEHDEHGEKIGDKLLRVRVSDHPDRRRSSAKYPRAHVEIGPHGMHWEHGVKHILKHAGINEEATERHVPVIYRILSNYSLGQRIRHGDKLAEYERARRMALEASVNRLHPEAPVPHPDAAEAPKADEWGKQNARQLEEKYASVRPRLEEIAKSVVKEPGFGSDDDEIENSSWESVGESIQEQVEKSWMKANYESYYDSEVENWMSKTAHVDALQMAIADVDEWIDDAIDEVIEDRKFGEEEPIPFTKEDIIASLLLRPEHMDSADLDIKFDDDKLHNPTNDYSPDQMTLDGIPPIHPPHYLTLPMREELMDAVQKHASRYSQDLLDNGKIEPPDYLSESAEESVGYVWDEMQDDEKFEYGKDEGLIETDSDGTILSDNEMPEVFDPIGEEGNEHNYARTRSLALAMSIERAYELVNEGRSDDDEKISKNKLRSSDHFLWSEWKGSSTSEAGKLLQIVTADVLGGRLRKYDKDYYVRYANQDSGFRVIGGYEGVKALVQAKWETTQYIMDKAGIQEIGLYRAVGIDLPENADAYTRYSSQRLDNLTVERNGAQSFTTKSDVANDWDGGHNRVVIRAVVPRTACLSVPAYGINVHKEYEVVVAGTAWKEWDAWRFEAPEIDEKGIDDISKTVSEAHTPSKQVIVDLGTADDSNYKKMHWLWFANNPKKRAIRKKHRAKWLKKQKARKKIRTVSEGFSIRNLIKAAIED